MAIVNNSRSDSSNGPPLPPRIKAAFDYLNLVRVMTTQWDVSLPARTLSPLEKNVQTAALRALQQYLLGEMDFAENAAADKPVKNDEADGTAAAPSGCEG
jgi:hypothetical protein